MSRTIRNLAAFNLQLLLSLAAVVAIGCKAEESKTADRDPVGKYQLISVNGNTVPCVVQHEGFALTVKSGTMDFHTNRACTSTTVFSPPSRADVQRKVEADYTREGSSLTLKWHGAGTTLGTFAGDQFTMDNEGMIFVYRK